MESNRLHFLSFIEEMSQDVIGPIGPEYANVAQWCDGIRKEVSNLRLDEHPRGDEVRNLLNEARNAVNSIIQQT